MDTIEATMRDYSFWIGMVAVFVFAWDRFGQQQVEIDQLGLPVSLRFFTTRFRYNFAAVVYSGIYATVYSALVSLSAFPAAQEVIMQWLGAVGNGVGDQPDVATPLGAAIVVNGVLPSVPGIHKIDIRLRAVLQDFASIPLKALQLADILIEKLDPKGNSSEPSQDASSLEQIVIYDKIKKIIYDLCNIKRLRTRHRYEVFFNRHHLVLEEIDQLKNVIQKELDGSSEKSSFLTKQMKELNAKLSRFLACGLLAVEPDEFHGLKTMSESLELPGIDVPSWRYRATHLIIGAFVVLLFGIAGSLAAAAWATILTNSNWNVLPDLAITALTVGVALVPIFLLPISFAAFANLHMIDREIFGYPVELEERIIAYVMTCLGCLCAALLFTTVLGVVAVSVTDRQLRLIQILPWTLPPAAVGFTFFLVSRRYARVRRNARHVQDFFVHALVASLAAALATALSQVAGLGWAGHVYIDFFALLLDLYWPIIILVGLLGGTLGALQCAMSNTGFFSRGNFIGRREILCNVDA
ncbi:hypothetical protein KG088_17530 [Halomonas sp. TRM85114]|uniref:hypothetical protein n=1 Tax=Halomonas jincaotanensis TaxID=2810616 RepID=UPI001BD69D6C|nr:hypothetical protein [Halomonas jincaotanensis]MBS9405412.1 hypothetical protein [Halomonas jincaotanensis]